VGDGLFGVNAVRVCFCSVSVNIILFLFIIDMWMF